MPKRKMKFPPVPGDTPRERFMNLVRHVFAVSKTQSKRTEIRPKPTSAKTP